VDVTGFGQNSVRIGVPMGHRSHLLDGFGDDFAWSLLDSAPDGIVVVAESGEVAFASDQAGVVFGCNPQDLVGISVDELLPPELRERHVAHRAHYRERPEVRSMGHGLQLRALRPDGTEFDAEISLSPLTLDQELFVVAAVRDIGERVAAAEALRVSQERLRDAQQVVALAEDRDRIARDLHDTVIQRLFAAGLSLHSLAGTVDERAQSRIETTVDDLDGTIRELRSAIFALRTPLAERPSLRARLLDVVADAARPLGFEPRIEMVGAVDDVPERIAEQVLPTVREALTNVAKHAEASTALVRLAVSEAMDELELVVADDGVGAARAHGSASPQPHELAGNGMHNIACRAEAVGGSVEAGPTAEGGWRVIWCAPL
jgi:PAS domain S-box-containing protein